MGLFDKMIKPADTTDQPFIEYPFQKKSKMTKTADMADKQSHRTEEAALQVTEPKAAKSKVSKPKDSKSKDSKSKTGKPKTSKSKAARSKASEAPVVEVLPAVKSSDAERAMSAPSLENAIVTKARDLSKLSREDLLQLLLTQSKDAERLQDYLRDVANEIERYTSLNARLREKLDAKDEKIERLKGRLDDKDKRIASMQAQLDELEVLKKEEERRSQIVVSAAEGVRGALEAFNATTDWYMASLQELCGDSDTQPVHTAPQATPGGKSKAADA